MVEEPAKELLACLSEVKGTALVADNHLLMVASGEKFQLKLCLCSQPPVVISLTTLL